VRREVVYWSGEVAAGHGATNAVVAFGTDLSNPLYGRSRVMKVMNKFSRIWLTLPLLALAILPARAQVVVDVAKITCEQYVLFTVADPHDIAMWLSGYFNGKKDNTVLDTQQFREHAKRVMDYCQLNLKTPVIEAAEKVLGLRK
jgi:acid stress chaperone HdeB